MLKPNANSGYIRPAHDRLGLVCSGSFLQLSLSYNIHRLPIHNEAGSLFSLPLWPFFSRSRTFRFVFGIIRQIRLDRLGFFQDF